VSTSAPLRLLAVGHSYVLATNRAILRELARDESFDISVAAPAYFHGDLRPLTLEPEPAGSRLTIIPLRAYLTRSVHVFAYHPADLRRVVSNGDYDVVHAWEEPYILGGYQIASALRGSPARFCFRTAQNNVKRYPPPFGHFEGAVLARAQRWIAGGQLVYDAMCRKGFPAETGTVLTLSVDTTEFTPSTAESRAMAKRAMGLTGPVIGYLGRFTKPKGIPLLLQAMDIVGMGRPWTLLLLGSGPLEDSIHRWAAKRGIAERVRVQLVRHDEVSGVLPAMDVMVAPSQTAPNWREQFGRMSIEAFAAGVPLIASDSGEIPTVAGDAAIIVPERDAHGFASAICRLLDSPDDCAELVRRGYLRAERYSSRQLARQFAEFYRELASTRCS